MFYRKMKLFCALFAMSFFIFAEDYLHLPEEGKYSKAELLKLKESADNGNIENAMIYGTRLILTGYNRKEGLKYLENAAEKDNSTAIYNILILTDYKTHYFYKKLVKLAKKDEQAKKLLLLYENPE